MRLANSSEANVYESIIWGNYADVGTNLLVAATSTVNLFCSVADSVGTFGAGSVVKDADTRSVDPAFCWPAYSDSLRWTEGQYTLAANSPCVPANSPCGTLIGALPADCEDLTVWTGAGGSTSWSNPNNWSGTAVPAYGAEVQVTRSNVVIASDVDILNLNHCTMNPVPDTLTISGGAALTFGASFSKADTKKAIKTIVIVIDDGDILFPCPPYCPDGFPDDFPVFLFDLLRILNGGIIASTDFIFAGDIAVPFGGMATFDVPLRIDNAISGTFVSVDIAGEATFLQDVSSDAFVQVYPGGIVNIEANFTNLEGGVIASSGLVTGGGQVVNLGSFVHENANGVALSVPFLNGNDFNVASGSFSAIEAPFTNLFNGQMSVDGQVSVLGAFVNHGDLTTQVGGQIDMLAQFTNSAQGVLSGVGTVDLSQSLYQDFGRLSPGFSPGILTLAGNYTASVSSVHEWEISGPIAGTDRDELRVTGAAFLDGMLVVRPSQNFAPVLGGTFTVVRAGVGGGGGAPLGGPGYTAYAGTQLSANLHLVPRYTPNRMVLVATDTLMANAAPTAVPDSVKGTLNSSTFIDVLANDIDTDGDPLRICYLSSLPASGFAAIDSMGTSLTYYAQAGFEGFDQFTYAVTDGRGTVDSTTVNINVAHVSHVRDLPPQNEKIQLNLPAPNPFNPATELSFELKSPGLVKMSIYDVRGYLIDIPVHADLTAGRHTYVWRGKDRRGREVGSGVYFVLLESQGDAQTQKMLLVR